MVTLSRKTALCVEVASSSVKVESGMTRKLEQLCRLSDLPGLQGRNWHGPAARSLDHMVRFGLMPLDRRATGPAELSSQA